MSNALLVLGNQLFDPTHAPLKDREFDLVFMREDLELCTHFKYHKQKILLFLMAMRSYADELRARGHSVDYQELEPSKLPYEKHLTKWLTKNSVLKISIFEIEDKFFEKRILETLENTGVEVEILRSPMFLTSRDGFKSYLSKNKRPFMRTFYEQQRKRLNIMVDENQDPVGGRWSFDELNRKPLPKSVEPPSPNLLQAANYYSEIKKVCEQHFSDHPGGLEVPWFATTREGAETWLEKFLEERFANFGPYEDALPTHSDFVFHSVLTPYLNTGLLTPDVVVRKAIRFANHKKLNISSVEGFVRQIIGWREFVRGIYQTYSETQDSTNFFQHTRKLDSCWYEGTTGIDPLDNVIKKVKRYGYAHHIERLMVVGNLMLLCEVEPREAHRWFMEMFIDSSDWVMGPNVYGMGLFSDGGIFATKPYICGSNYYRKMGSYRKAEWCDGVDGLYWGFIEKHSKSFLQNPRLSMMVRSAENMDEDKKGKLQIAARTLRDRITSAN